MTNEIFDLTEIFVEYQNCPIGIDIKNPSFSWKITSELNDIHQKYCFIEISDKTSGEIVWDFREKTDCSTGIRYAGKDLLPCSEYIVKVIIEDTNERIFEGKTYFETGFLDSEGFNSSTWIEYPEYYVDSFNKGIFEIETAFRLSDKSKKIGLIFGANDPRLLDPLKNEYHLAGENYFLYQISKKDDLFYLNIYRIGYHPLDSKEVPLATIKLVDENGNELLHENNYREEHCLKVQINGNNSVVYFDGQLIDGPMDEYFPDIIRGRTLNPRGFNDVITYPRLNDIGFFAEGEGYFKYLSVRHLREPGNCFIYESPKGNLYEQATKFDLPIKDDYFQVNNQTVTISPSYGGLPMFRKEFSLTKKLKKARLYITSHGIYNCEINGMLVNDSIFSPGLTQYNKRLSYQTYDITDKLKESSNAIGVTLSSGWWSGGQTYILKNYNYFGDKEGLLVKIEIEYQNGEKEIIGSDESWKCNNNGPYKYSSFFYGEYYDGTIKDNSHGYSLPGFCDTFWKNAIKHEVVGIPEVKYGFGREWPELLFDDVKLIGEYAAPVKIVKEVVAKKRIKVSNDTYIYDLGQEIAGVPSIKINEKHGTEIILRYGEFLYPDLPEYGELVGELMVENYRDATSIDRYICFGQKDEIIQPRFTFHGFRYIEVSGCKNPPEIIEVKGLQYSSISELEGTFESSNKLLDKFCENVYWSQLCNFINVPTDCPQRNERLGWAGDTHIFCETAIQNSHLKLFYERNLQAMVDLQTESGQLPAIAPVGGGFGGITYECALIFISWTLYQHYGDKHILLKFYPTMKKYMKYMEDKNLASTNKTDAEVGGLADWLAIDETDENLMWDCFYFKELDLMWKISLEINQLEAANLYKKKANQVKEFWNNTYVDKETKKTISPENQLIDTQTSYALPLVFNIVEEKNVSSFGDHLVSKTISTDYHVRTGFFGTGVLVQALTDAGRSDIALKTLLQESYPSWLYPVTQGATTIWERWNSYTKEEGFGGNNSMNSFNHYSLGSVQKWIYSEILGIKPKNIGYQEFILKPMFASLEKAKGSISTPYGKIVSSWKKEKNNIIYQCEIPTNTTAELILNEGTSGKILGSGIYTFSLDRA